MPAGIYKAGIRVFNQPEGRQYLQGGDAVFTAAFPAFSATFTSNDAVLQATFPAFEVEFVSRDATLHTTFPVFAVDLTAQGGAVATLDAVFPAFSASFTHQREGAFAVTFPAFDVSFTGAEGDQSAVLNAVFQSFSATFISALQAPLSDVTDYEVWVVNRENQLHSQYDNWQVDSLGEFNGVTLAALPTGIFELAGDDDAGEPIASKVYWAPSDFGTSRQKRLDSAFINMRNIAQQPIRLVVIADEQERRNYTKDMTGRPDGMRRHRQTLTRGLQGQTWQVGFENIGGGDFALSDIEVEVIELQRRVK